MKNIYILFVFIFITSLSFAQNAKPPKTEKKGKLTEVTIFYDSGEIMQHGFYTRSGKLHGGWESYYEDSSLKCIAFYDKDVKVGTWTYFYKNKKTNVVYNNNKIISVIEIELDSKNLNNTN